MEDLEFDPLTITPTTEGQRRVIGRGESLNTTISIEAADDEQLEKILRMRWPAFDHEKAVVERYLNKKLELREYMQLIEESQTIWAASGKPQQIIYQMAGNAGESSGSAKRKPNSSLHSVIAVCVNEFWAFSLRKRHADSVALLAIASTANFQSEIIWTDSEIEVKEYRAASAYFDHLFLVDGLELKAIDVPSAAVMGTIDLVSILKEHINSEAPPRITHVRASECFVVLTVQSQGAIVFLRQPGLPCIGFLQGNVSIAVPDHKEMFAVCLQSGEVLYWHINIEAGGLEMLEKEVFFTDDQTTASKEKIKMQPEPVWNALISGPHVAVSSRQYFVMADRNPASPRIAKLDDAGTLDYFTPFADFIATGEHAGAVLMHEYASGNVFYRSDEPKVRCPGKFSAIGSQHIAFAYDRIIDLLPNGNVLVITTRINNVGKISPQ